MNGKTLQFGDVTREADVRMLDEMRDLLLDRDFARDANNRPLYYMYRDLYRSRDKEVIHDNDLRYDITVIPPAHLGREYVKTKGHYHPVAANGVQYPEIYEVIAGTAHYLLQKKANSGNSQSSLDRANGSSSSSGTITDVVVVDAEAGDKVIIPPGYGHITINPGDKPLKMANWVSSRFESQYQDMVEKRGGAYYETVAGDFVRNHNYDDVPNLRKADPAEVPDLKIRKKTPMYKLIRAPDNLAFLNRPHKFQWVFDDLY